SLDVGDLARRVCYRFGEDELCALGDRRGIVRRVGAADKRRVDAETAEGDIQLGDRPAVEVGGTDDVVTGADETREGDVLRAQATRGGDGTDAALEARNALLEARDRRVGEP